MKKYGPLYDYLNTCGKVSLRLTFDDIEKIIDKPLPPSVTYSRQWWENPTNIKQHPQATAWLSAGYKVSAVNMSERWVEFIKE